jgi:AcrR family transcriptional regulator
MSPRSPDAGSREERRARIEQVALELFLTRGFDHVTVEDVSALSGVAPATFYRYFGSKEDVVFAYRDDFAAALLDAVEAATALPDHRRLPAVLIRFAGFLESQQDLLQLRDRIVLGHPRLMQRTLSVQRDMESILATGLAGSRGLTEPDPTSLLEAGVGLLVLRLAVRSWRTTGEGSLPEATRRTIALLREVSLSSASC